MCPQISSAAKDVKLRLGETATFKDYKNVTGSKLKFRPRTNVNEAAHMHLKTSSQMITFRTPTVSAKLVAAVKADERNGRPIRESSRVHQVHHSYSHAAEIRRIVVACDEDVTRRQTKALKP